MSPRSLAGAAWRVLAFLARPVRRAQGRGDLVVEPYRGYGSRSEIFLAGRVFRQTRPGGETGDDLRSLLRDIARRVRRRKVVGARLTLRFGAATAAVETDRDGYFQARLPLVDAPPGREGWHEVAVTLDAVPPVAVRGTVFVPPPGCRFAVVSDIDDTVMRTGVANKAKMLWRLFVADAESRVAFPGVAALYRALHAGAGGAEHNPMLYVSRAPWGIYDMLTAFFRQHGIPVGPVLLLREWGLSWTRPLPRRAEAHKRDLIEHMLEVYRDLPFVLIGDSGQHDPEVYADLVRRHPGRVAVVYIRDVSRGAGRGVEIRHLAEAVTAVGSRLVLARDSIAIAQDAAAMGLIAPDAVAAVSRARAADGEPTDRAEPSAAVVIGAEAGTDAESAKVAGTAPPTPGSGRR